MKRCTGCMEMHEEELQECPHCGYSKNTKIEPYYLKPGTELFNSRYTIGNVLGRGGFGITYIAWDFIADKKVTIKEYFPSEFSSRGENSSMLSVFSGSDEEYFRKGLASFMDEARRLARLNQIDGVIGIYDCFEENNTAYIVMEYLEGETLASKLERENKMNVDEAINMLIPIMKSLINVHKEGIIHRDISPDNIFVLKDGTAKLIDFGAARIALAEQTKSLTVIVKAGFSPEEQYTVDGKQGEWTDVYALAATLYRMITGVKPSDAIARTSSINKKGKDTLLTVKECGVTVNSNINSAIENALEVNAESRTQSVQLFLNELQNTIVAKKGKEFKINGKIICISLVLLLLLVFIVTFCINVYPGKLISNIVKTVSNDDETNETGKDKEKDDTNNDVNKDTNKETTAPDDMDGKVYVSEVTGLSEEEAINTLKELGLEAECVYVDNSELDDGVVISQNPTAESCVEKNSIITLQICKKANSDENKVTAKPNSDKSTKAPNANNNQSIEPNTNTDNSTDNTTNTGNGGSSQTVIQPTENPYKDFEYTVSVNNITINKYLGTLTSVVIPSTIEGRTVTAIGDGAFNNFYDLKSIYIPGTIKSISANSFYDCHSLETITYGGSESEWKSMSVNALYNNKLVVTAHKNESIAFANALDTSYTNLTTNSFGYGYCICYGKDYFVSGTSRGLYYMEKNGKSWTAALSTTGGGFLGVCYAKGLFVAVGFEGIYTSTNAKTWTKACDSDTLWTINYGNGKYVAVGEGTSYYSTDGKTWTKNVISASKSKIMGSTYGNGRFVAAGENGESYYSTDGVSWSKMSGISSKHTIHDITYGKGKYIAVGYEGTSYYSTDGKTWTQTSGLITSLDYNGVTFANNQFRAYGWQRNMATSSDGVNWSAPTPTSENATEDITYRDGASIYRATVIFEK